MQDWWWIRGDLNIADIMTRGGAPEDLKENSTWQTRVPEVASGGVVYTIIWKGCSTCQGECGQAPE